MDEEYELVDLSTDGAADPGEAAAGAAAEELQDDGVDDDAPLLGGDRRDAPDAAAVWAAGIGDGAWLSLLRLAAAGCLLSGRHVCGGVLFAAALGRAFVLLPWGLRLAADAVPPFALLVAYSRARLARRRLRAPPRSDAQRGIVRDSDHPQRRRLRAWLARRTEWKKALVEKRCNVTRGGCARRLERWAAFGTSTTCRAWLVACTLVSALDAASCIAEVVLCGALRRYVLLGADGAVEHANLSLAVRASETLAACAAVVRLALVARCCGVLLREQRPGGEAPRTVRCHRDALRLLTAATVGAAAALVGVAGRSASELNIVAAADASNLRGGGEDALPFPSLRHIRRCATSPTGYAVAVGAGVVDVRGGRLTSAPRTYDGMDGFSAAGPIVFALDDAARDAPLASLETLLLRVADGAVEPHGVEASGQNIVSLVPKRALRSGAAHVAAVFARHLAPQQHDGAFAHAFALAVDRAGATGAASDEADAAAAAAVRAALRDAGVFEEAISAAVNRLEQLERDADALRNDVLPALARHFAGNLSADASSKANPRQAWAFVTKTAEAAPLAVDGRALTTKVRVALREAQRDTRLRRKRPLEAWLRGFGRSGRVANVVFGAFPLPRQASWPRVSRHCAVGSANPAPATWLDRVYKRLAGRRTRPKRDAVKFSVRLPLVEKKVAPHIRGALVHIHELFADRASIVHRATTSLADALGVAVVAAERQGASKADAIRWARALLSDANDLVDLAQSETRALVHTLALARRAAGLVQKEARRVGSTADFGDDRVIILARGDAAAFGASLVAASGLFRAVLIEPSLPRALALRSSDGDSHADAFRDLLRFQLTAGDAAIRVLYGLLEALWEAADGGALRPGAALDAVILASDASNSSALRLLTAFDATIFDGNFSENDCAALRFPAVVRRYARGDARRVVDCLLFSGNATVIPNAAADAPPGAPSIPSSAPASLPSAPPHAPSHAPSSLRE